MKKNTFAKIALVLAGALSLASCDLGSFIKILTSLTPIGANIDDDRENREIKLEYETGEGFLATETKYDYELINDSTANFPCRAYGDIKLLVIPVKIKGYENVATQDNLTKIKNAFFGETKQTGWESVSSFYKKSSYGLLNISGTVTDEWYDCGLTTNELTALEPAPGTNNSGSFDKTWPILEGAVDWYKTTYHDNCTQFDNDGDGLIDGVWLVYGAPNHKNKSSLNEKLFWAYNFKDYSVDINNRVPSNPVGYSYCWASYDFMEAGGYGSGAEQVDAHTYIHETGHLLGLEDYYVSNLHPGELNYGPMGGLDMMDYNILDHNAWSKYSYGWIKPYVVSDSCEITLKPSCTSGQAIILPTSNGFNGSAFDEFIMMEYYTPDVLNYQDSFFGYSSYPHGFTENGVRIYHVDARIATSTTSGATATYDDNFEPNDERAMVAASNSSGINKRNTERFLKASSLPENFLKFRLIQELDCEHKRNFDTEKQVVAGREVGCFADNSTLFQNGDTFNYSSYKESFPNYVYGGNETMNDGGTLPWNVTFSESSDSSIKVTITKQS